MIITDKSAIPVYQHFIYDKHGIFIYLRYSFSNKADDNYLNLLNIQKNERKILSEKIRNLNPKDRKKELERIPDILFWKNGISEIFPQNEHKNDGGIRRKRLMNRLKKKFPLFIDEFYDKEITERNDYFTGNHEYDRIKSEARNKYTDEYWHSFILAECNFYNNIYYD